MSETVHYRGTAQRVDLKRLTNEEFAKQFIKNEGKEIPSYCESALEYLTDRWYDDFFFYQRNQTLYKIKHENIDPDDEIIKAEFDPASDKINFELRYYNGGVGFDECLKEAFDKIIK